MKEYDDTPVGRLRQITKARSIRERGDPRKVADAIVTAADDPSPLGGVHRVVLGSDAHHLIRRALRSQLVAVESGPDVAYSTGADDLAAREAPA